MTTLNHICQTLVQCLTEPEPADPAWPPETWPAFQLAGRVHGVAPLLQAKLEGAAWVDPANRAWLAEQRRLNGQRVARMQEELQAILARFARRDLPLLPLKGAILTALYYPEPGLRPMADLDILIRAEDYEAGARLLAELGYEPGVRHWKHVEFVKPDNRQVVSREGEHPDNPRGVEVHLACRETFGGPTLDLTETMWANAAPGALLGEPALLPRPEALWLHLLVHASYHAWQGRGRLIHLLDLAQVAPHLSDPLPWLNGVDARYTYPALSLLRKYFPTAIGADLLLSQTRRVSAGFARWSAGLDLVNTSYLNPDPPGPYLLKALKFGEGRPAEVLQALRFALLPRLDELALDHPRLASSGLPWLAYFLLPFDWATRLRKKDLSR